MQRSRTCSTCVPRVHVKVVGDARHERVNTVLRCPSRKNSHSSTFKPRHTVRFGSQPYTCLFDSNIQSRHAKPHFAPPEFNHENAEAPPMGFDFVFTVPPGVVAVGVGTCISLLSGVLEPLFSKSLFRRPSSKNRLRPSAGLLTLALVAAVEEKARLAVFGLSTRIPASLR